MGEQETPPIDLDLETIGPADLARLLISRACDGSDLAWAEIGWDAARYPRTSDLVVHLVGFCEQLLGVVGHPRGMTATETWQQIMLNEAESGDRG